MAQATQTAASKADPPRPAKLKGRVQKGYLVLRSLLEQSGHAGIAQSLAVWETVDDVMREAPELVPSLLAIAWERRTDETFGDLFAAEDGSGIAETQDDPMAPCGRSYRQIVQSHLFATTRLNIDKAEREWATKEARRARARWRKEQEQAPKGLLKGLLKKTKEPEFSPDDFRSRFPGHGLYEALKPHLSRPDQFALVRSYVSLPTSHVVVLGDLLESFTTTEQIDFIASLTEGDLSVLKSCAGVYAQWKLGLRRQKKATRGPNQDPPTLSNEDKLRVSAEESVVFRDIMANHHGAVQTLRNMGPNADRVIDLLAPVFGDIMWTIVGDQDTLTNVINTPEHLIPVLGIMSRHVTPELSNSLLQVNDQEIVKDLLRFARETFKDNELAFYLSDPSRLPVWDSLPAKFNNNFKYQRDAMKSNLIRNEEDLRTVASGIFNSLRQGRVL